MKSVSSIGFFISYFCIKMIDTHILDTIHKGVSFQRNCGAASVEEYNRVIEYYQLSW